MDTRVRRSLVFAMAVIALALAAAVAAGCSADFNMSCGGSETGIKTYTNSDYGFSFEYPAAWKVEEGDAADLTAGGKSVSDAGVFDPEGAEGANGRIDGVMVSVYKLNFAVEASMLPDVKPEMEALVANLLTQDSTWKVTEALSDAKVGELSGFKASLAFAASSDTPAKCTMYFLFDGDIEYQLVAQSATANWDKDKAAFDAIVASFKPGAAK
jgi:hypothetical protein